MKSHNRTAPAPSALHERGFRLVFGLLVFGLAGSAAAENGTLPCPAAMTPYDASYTTKYQKLTMEGTRQLKRLNNGAYRLVNDAKAMGGSITERTTFSVTPQGFRVKRYDMTRSILAIKREYHTRYDWESGQARVSGHVEATLPLDQPLHDLLSYQLALRCDIEQGHDEMSYPLIARNKIRTYQFARRGTETLQTALGSLETIVVDRVRDSDDKRTTRIWLAPELNHILVKLEQYEPKDDTTYRLELNNVVFADRP
jgi:hypothetical protein